MSNTDRGFRTVIAFALIVLYLANLLNGTTGIVALSVAGIFLLTSYFGYCPLYALFGHGGKSKKV